MSPVGTLRSDGKLAPPGDKRSTPSVSKSSLSSNQTSDDDLFFTPMAQVLDQSNYPINANQPITANVSKSPAQQPIKKLSAQNKPIRKSSRSGKFGKTGVGNPTYERVALPDDCITGTPKQRALRSKEESIYLTPCAPGTIITSHQCSLDLYRVNYNFLLEMLQLLRTNYLGSKWVKNNGWTE